MYASYPKHKDCAMFKDGKCTRFGVEVDPEGPACPMFTPKEGGAYGLTGPGYGYWPPMVGLGYWWPWLFPGTWYGYWLLPWAYWSYLMPWSLFAYWWPWYWWLWYWW